MHFDIPKTIVCLFVCLFVLLVAGSQVIGSGPGTPVGFGIWSASTQRHPSPDPKPSSNSDLPLAWITGPTTKVKIYII
jgi:hypothetical protein